jgi:hypothetical protein
MTITAGNPVVQDTPKPGVRGKAAAALLTVGLLLGGGVALTQLGGSSATTAATTAGAQGGVQGGGPGGGGGAPASGTIASVSGTSISVKTTAGTVSTFTVSSATAIEDNGASATATQLTVGEQVVVFSGSAPGSSAA